MDPFRNYDAWKTASPYDYDPPDPWQLLRRCSCGAWLRQKPDEQRSSTVWIKDYSERRPEAKDWIRNIRRVEMPGDDWEVWEFEYEQHVHVAVHTCRKCGTSTEFSDL